MSEFLVNLGAPINRPGDIDPPDETRERTDTHEKPRSVDHRKEKQVAKLSPERKRRCSEQSLPPLTARDTAVRR